MQAREARIAELSAKLQAQSEAAALRLNLCEKEWSDRLEIERERSSRISGLETQVAVAQALEQELKGRLAKQEAEVENEIQRRVEQELSRVVRPWLNEARWLENLSATRSDLVLEAKVRKLLHAQRALDMKYGSRSRLRNRLVEFEKLAEEIRWIFRDSLKPQAELHPLLGEIELAAQDLRRKLAVDHEKAPFICKLEDAIHQSATQERLSEMQELIDSLSNMGVLPGRQRGRLFRILHVAFDRLQMQLAPDASRPRLRNGWELQGVLARNRPATVYFDGNNVLHQMEERYGNLLEDLIKRARASASKHVPV